MWGQEEEQSQEQQTQESGSELLQPVKVLNDIDQKFDALYNDIIGNLNTYNLHSSKMQNIAIQDISKSLTKQQVEMSGESDSEKEKKEIDKLLNAESNDIIGTMDEFTIPSERKKRYEFYDEIPNVNYIAHRMLKVYLDNILIKNVQTKQIINVSENSDNSFFLDTVREEVGKHYDNFLKSAIIFFDLQNKLKNKIVPGMLKYGNIFVEILNLKQVAELSKNFGLISETITDGYIDNVEKKGSTYCTFESELLEESSVLKDKTELDATQKLKKLLKRNSNLIQEESSHYWSDIVKGGEETDFTFGDINKLDFDELQNIHLKVTSPNQVIIVENDGFLYGYLIIESEEGKQGNEIDILKRFTQQEDSKNGGSEEQVRQTIIEKMTKGVIKKLNDVISNKRGFGGEQKAFNHLGLGENIENSIKIILYHKIKENQKLKFRFVAPDKLINYSTNIDKFGPYGTSIFDPIIQPVKMYTLALMSSIVSRLSRASVVRKWTIEAGNKKNHAEIIEKVKRDINNKSISFDSLSNIKNIAQNITDFRDIATIQVNGQRFIDMEVMPMGDRSLPLNDLQDLRNELIAATGIPSVYLNIGDQVDLRESLVSLNTSFATTISSFQSNIDDSNNQLLNGIFSIILENNGYDDSEFILSNYYKLNLNPPLILTVQANEALISSVSNIIGMLRSAELVVDPEALLKLYIPQMNWADLLKSGKNFIKKQAKEQLMQPQE